MQARHRTERRQRRWGVLVAAVALALGACSGGTTADDPTAAATGGGATTGTEGAPLGALPGLGPCEVEPVAIDDDPVDGLVLPPDAVLTEQADDGPLTTAKGYVPMTPIQVRVFYEESDEVEVVQIEDEVRESEGLFDVGEMRLFVKAQAVCAEGSVFVAIVAPRAAEGQLPAPTGTPAP
jgi:hypothetical protein